MPFPIALLTAQLLVASPAPAPAPAEPVAVAVASPAASPAVSPNEAGGQTLRARARSVTWAGAAVAGTGSALWLTGYARARLAEDDEAHRRAQHLATGGAATAVVGACVMAVGWLLWTEADDGFKAAAVSVSVDPRAPGVSVGGRF